MKSLSDLEYFGENLQLLEAKIVPTSTQGIVLPFQKQHIEYEGVANMNFSKPKLFISHSTNDSEYVTLIVRLLEGIGVNDIFCSSIPGYGIPLKKDIYEYLREQFQDHELYVLFVLSDHYYNSIASLNEMGAAWVLQKESLCILLPGFEFNEIQGAVNPREIYIKLDDNELTVLEYLNQWKTSLESYFGLTPIQQARWERIRKEFLDGVLKLGAERSDAEKSE